MVETKKKGIISAETVSRLVSIGEYNLQKSENTLPGKVRRYYNDKRRCESCKSYDKLSSCKFMRENRYYPPKCVAYQERGKK